MSRARMVKRRWWVAMEKAQRSLGRRNHECRMRHWRQMLRTMECSEWMRPCNQDVRLAYLTVRCQEHRTNIRVTLVVDGDVERNAKDVGSLSDILYLKFRDARFGIIRMLVPQRYRREFAV